MLSLFWRKDQISWSDIKNTTKHSGLELVKTHIIINKFIILLTSLIYFYLELKLFIPMLSKIAVDLKIFLEDITQIFGREK